MDGAVIIDSATSRRSCARPPSWSPIPRSRPARPARGTAPPTASPSRPASRSSASASRCTSSRCTSRAGATCSRSPAAILSRANQALATLERYKQRLDEVSRSLSALEIEDLVTVREVCATLQRLEMVRHIASEIRAYLLELGTEGRLVSLQLAELVAGVETDRELVVRDYLPAQRSSRKDRDRGRHAGGPGPHRAHRPARADVGGPRPGLPGEHRRPGDQRQSARASAAVPGPARARGRARPAREPLRHRCRRCSGPRWTTCRRWRGSARTAPATSARACPGLAESSILERYV